MEYTYRKGKNKTKLLEIAQQHFRKKKMEQVSWSKGK